jgi:hypothetical protein
MSQNQNQNQVTMPAEGDFSFIQDEMERTMYQEMYTAITAAGAWDDMKADPGDGGFMFSGAPVISKVCAHLNDSVGHSGSSFGITMRKMQRLACVGWGAWASEVCARAEEKRQADRKMAEACFAAAGQDPHSKCPHGIVSYACMPCSH